MGRGKGKMREVNLMSASGQACVSLSARDSAVMSSDAFTLQDSWIYTGDVHCGTLVFGEGRRVSS